MTDLVRFTRRADLAVLTQAAIALAQFETIHPFQDRKGGPGGRSYNRSLTPVAIDDLGVGIDAWDGRRYGLAGTRPTIPAISTTSSPRLLCWRGGAFDEVSSAAI